jgi:hypothetical protein
VTLLLSFILAEPCCDSELYGVVITASGSTAIVVAGTEYREKIKDSPEPLNGHTGAEHEEDTIGEILLLREDGFSHNLKER